jgi:UDP-3-O-[3-hydroxymyristoyl] glucosamine N-acyltransferase
MELRLAAIVESLGGELLGDPEHRVDGIASLERAGPRQIGFVAQDRYAGLLRQTRAGCLVVRESLREAAAARGPAIVCDDPYHYYARLSQWWARAQRVPVEPGVHPTAWVEDGAVVDRSAHVGPWVQVCRHAVVAAGAVIEASCHIGAGARVGEGTRMAPRAVLMHGCSLGARGIVHSGAVIGADGFGFAPHQGRWEKIEQLGGVCIGDDVEIGANTCIDRGALEDTVLEDGVKLDNLVQIGHNVHVGAHTAMAGCAGVAGSARIGRHCTLGGGAIVLGHLELVDHVHITAATVVTRSIREPGRYSGLFPFDDNASWEKNAATLRQLHSLRERIRALEKKP